MASPPRRPQAIAMAVDTEAPAAATSPKKRHGPDTSRAFYPRKRSSIACEVCRARKSKCDNRRPTCGFCASHDSNCVYREAAADHSSYDIASLEILGRINHVAQLLEDQAHVLQSRLPPSPAVQYYASPVSNGHSSGPSVPLVPSVPSESLEVGETVHGTCEDMLDWPIFEGKLPRSEIESLIFNPEQTAPEHWSMARSSQPSADRRAQSKRGYAPGSVINEANALALVRRFLANVHIKNPVLDDADLGLLAREVMENGFQWDGKSCLVLIVCALACISSPYTTNLATSEASSEEEPSAAADSMSACGDYTTAESYYLAAQKRIGLLEVSILSTQCHFLFGVYEMYSLRTIRAWGSFTRACNMFTVYVRGRPKSSSRKIQRLERRLYWSCLKSECEMRSEICLPSSGLTRVDYPDAYPSPPCGSPEPEPLGSFADGGSATSERSLNADVENSWSYYLSDIAVRRIGNRLAESFYSGKEETWLTMPLERIIRIAEEFELQLTQWYEYLPRPVSGEWSSSHSSSAAEELTTLLEGRFLEFRERIYRPFLYIAIHGTQSPSAQASCTIESYVQRWLDASLTHILKGSHRHRHHGTWYQNRKVYGNCLLLLAAVKSRRVTVPSTWREAVDKCISGLNFWAREAPDLGKAKKILEDILQTLDIPSVSVTSV